ncbi:hypothetical protein D3C81_1515580 [compost metagenome]
MITVALSARLYLPTTTVTVYRTSYLKSAVLAAPLPCGPKIRTEPIRIKYLLLGATVSWDWVVMVLKPISGVWWHMTPKVTAISTSRSRALMTVPMCGSITIRGR